MATDLNPPPGYSRGLVPRNYGSHPVGYFAKPFDLPLIPKDEWEDRLRLKLAAEADLESIRNHGMHGVAIPSRDQNGRGYCWMHSGVSAMLLDRAKAGLPYVDLSAYGPACLIKNYRDEGGWGSQGVEWLGTKGCPTSKTWPQRSVSPSNDTAAMRAESLRYMATEWMDGEPRNLAQLITALLLDIPIVSDFNWWVHSVCTMKLLSINPLRTRILNSWGDSWSENGAGTLEGSQALPDGMVFLRSSAGSV